MAEQRMILEGQTECGRGRRWPAKKSGKQTGTRRSQKQAYLFLLPSLAILTVFVFYSADRCFRDQSDGH